MSEIRYEDSGSVCSFSDYIDDLEQELSKLRDQLAQRDEAIKVMREALIDITDHGENYAPEGKEIWLLAYTSLKKPNRF